jgi:hypothetical protein
MVASIIVVLVAAITAAAFGGASFVAAFSCSPYFASMPPRPPPPTTAKIQIRPHLARPSRPTESSLAGSFHNGDEEADYNCKRLADDTKASANPLLIHQKTTRGTTPSLGSAIKVSQQRSGTLL